MTTINDIELTAEPDGISMVLIVRGLKAEGHFDFKLPSHVAEGLLVRLSEILLPD